MAVLMRIFNFSSIRGIPSLNAGLSRRFYANPVGIRTGLVENPLAVLGARAVATMKAPIICLSGRDLLNRLIDNFHPIRIFN